MAQVQDWQGMREWCADLLVRRTGEGVAEWNARIAEAAPETEPAMRAWLAERGVTGYAQMLLVMERFGYPEFMLASADDLIDGQYADRPHLRPILDRLLMAAGGLGDVTVQARKGYVSLVGPRRQFAIVAAPTRKRVDLGLRLDGQAMGGRLKPASGLGNESITVRIELSSVDEIDTEALDLLARAYAANA